MSHRSPSRRGAPAVTGARGLQTPPTYWRETMSPPAVSKVTKSISPSCSTEREVFTAAGPNAFRASSSIFASCSRLARSPAPTKFSSTVSPAARCVAAQNARPAPNASSPAVRSHCLILVLPLSGFFKSGLQDRWQVFISLITIAGAMGTGKGRIRPRDSPGGLLAFRPSYARPTVRFLPAGSSGEEVREFSTAIRRVPIGCGPRRRLRRICS